MLLKLLNLDTQIQTSIPFWAWPNLLSLDAVFVALIWQWFFAKSFSLTLHWQEELVLALTVWLIYVADRLFDRLKLDISKEHSLRHEFYFRFPNEFAALAALVLLIDIYFVITGLAISIIAWGLSLFGLILLYGLGLHLFDYARAYKEIYIGILFSLGVNLVFLKDLNPEMLIAIAIFAILASLNCLLISKWEHNADLAQNYNSNISSRQVLNKSIVAAMYIFIFSSLILFVASLNQIYFALFLALLVLLALDISRGHISTLLLRILVDVALLSPIVFVLTQYLFKKSFI